MGEEVVMVPGAGVGGKEVEAVTGLGVAGPLGGEEVVVEETAAGGDVLEALEDTCDRAAVKDRHLPVNDEARTDVNRDPELWSLLLARGGRVVAAQVEREHSSFR